MLDGTGFDEMGGVVREAFGRYRRFLHDNRLSDSTEAFDRFSLESPESVEWLGTYSWLSSVNVAQMHQKQGCQISESESGDHEFLQMTQAWPVVATRAGLPWLIEQLMSQKMFGHYLITTETHAIALSIEQDRIMLFDQNAPCYFSGYSETASQALARLMFSAILPPLKCENLSLHTDYAEVQCGTFSARLPATGRGTLGDD